MNRRPNINSLLSIKKTVKALKAQLRLKLVEKNNFEEVWNCYSVFICCFQISLETLILSIPTKW